MFALITGASSGVGKGYAEVLARDYNHDLLLISNQEQQLNEVANHLRDNYSVKVLSLYKDLSLQSAAREIYDWCHKNHIEVDILINNAGVFFFKPLDEVSEQFVSTMLNLHILTLTQLCKLFGEDMIRRNYGKPKSEHKRGYILNMSSMTAWMSMPGIQCYNATKAYVLNFSKALYYEYKPFSVTVTAITPGAIDTPLYGLDNNTRRRLVKAKISYIPERFAQIALKKMFRGKKQAMPGWINHLAVPIINHLPDWTIFFAMKKLPNFKDFYKKM